LDCFLDPEDKIPVYLLPMEYLHKRRLITEKTGSIRILMEIFILEIIYRIFIIYEWGLNTPQKLPWGVIDRSVSAIPVSVLVRG